MKVLQILMHAWEMERQDLVWCWMAALWEPHEKGCATPGDILGSSHPSTVWVSWVLDHTLPQAHISASSLLPPTLPSSAFSFPSSIAPLELFLIVSTILSRFSPC